MTSISKYVYIDKLDDLVNEHNDIYYQTMGMKPTDVNTRTYIGFKVENNDKNSKFQDNNRVRVSKYENIFANIYTPN